MLIHNNLATMNNNNCVQRQPRSAYLVRDGFNTQHFSAGGHTLRLDSYYEGVMYFTPRSDLRSRDWKLDKKHKEQLMRTQRAKPQTHYS